MRIFSENGKVLAETTNYTIDISGGNLGTRKLLRSTGFVHLAAVSNDGDYVAVSPKKAKAILIFRWTGARWKVEGDFELPDLTRTLDWNEEAWTPEVKLMLRNRERCRLYSWTRGWKLQRMSASRH